jgi:hypothetical protein
MNSAELKMLREQHWRSLAAHGLSEQSLLEFVREVGFALFGGHEGANLPAIEMLVPPRDAARSLGWAHAMVEANLATVKLVELQLWPGMKVYVHAELLPFVYASVGDRRPDRDFLNQQKAGRLSELAAEMFRMLLSEGQPMSRNELRDRVGAQRVSSLAVERAMAELAPTLKVLRVGMREGEPIWQATVRAAPTVKDETLGIAKIHAAGALISKYLGTMLAAKEEDIARFFVPVFPSSRTHSALLGLSAGREVALDSIDGVPAYRLALTRMAV